MVGKQGKFTFPSLSLVSESGVEFFAKGIISWILSYCHQNVKD
jgi:hypothetical protein